MTNEGSTGNWGRWGPDDQLGAANLVDAASRLRAIAAVRQGQMYSLSHPLSSSAPVVTGTTPFWHEPLRRFNPASGHGSSDDVVVMRTHTGTHLDALCHHWSEEGLYNGHPHEGVGRRGNGVLSMEQLAGIITRAIVLDVSSSCPSGKDGWGHVIGVDHLDKARERADLRIEPGDAVLIRTGWVAELYRDPEVYAWSEPGLGEEAAIWLAEQDVCLVGADNWAIEVIPPPIKGRGLYVHTIFLNHYGIYLLENLDLDQLVADNGSCEGLFALAPLRITDGAGSPVNPLILV